MRVRFTKHDTPFKRGDVKECTEAEARKHVRHGVAVVIEDDGTELIEEPVTVTLVAAELDPKPNRKTRKKATK